MTDNAQWLLLRTLWPLYLCACTAREMPRLFCSGREVLLETGVVYSEADVFQLCLAARQAAGAPDFGDVQLRFEDCPAVPVPFEGLLLTCNILSKLHNESEARACSE
jgi:hypothetical protein